MSTKCGCVVEQKDGAILRQDDLYSTQYLQHYAMTYNRREISAQIQVTA